MSAMNQATAGTPYRVPPEPRRWSAIVLAVAVHALLLTFLVVGISWQNNKPAAVEAEVWDMKVQTAAPPPPPPQETEPEPEPEPAPAPKVIEPPAPPAPVPDIRIEQEKKRKEELKQKQLAEEQAREEQKARELAEKKEAEKQAREEQKARELAEKKQADEDAKKEAEKKAKAEKAAKAKAEATAKMKNDMRKQELQRMMAQAGSGTSGSAAKSTAPRMDSGYIAAITAKIKSNTTYPGSTDVPGNPKVSFQVEQLPTGDIISVKMIKSSGLPAFDRAVENGIHKSSPLPHKKDGTVERTLLVDFSMKDLD
jgi:colicin import membrane protein